MHDTRLSAFLGSLVADALAMPAHWYYDRDALRRDYGLLDDYRAPLSPHPGSILWRSTYTALNERGDILREQAVYWGQQKGIHYHQFLEAGENTLNFRLATELWMQVRELGRYDAALWLERYIELMLQPDWHRDTYVEEYHRGFFTNYARGRKPSECGIVDNHIGGLARVPALLAALPEGSTLDDQRSWVKEDVALTHRQPAVQSAADCLVRLLHEISAGTSLEKALVAQAGDWFSLRQAQKWSAHSDLTVVGEKLSPACYIDESFPAALYLGWKYTAEFTAGIVANAMVGGDNCHRGTVVGALLGAVHGVPDHWLPGLKAMDRIGPTALKT